MRRAGRQAPGARCADGAARPRQALAALSATTVPYLYDIAAGTRTPSAKLALHIEDASRAIRVRTGGKSRIVTVREIADIKTQATESEKS